MTAEPFPTIADVRASLSIVVLMCGCARPAAEETPTAAIRFERMVGGRCQSVILFPRQGVYVMASWTLRSPEWIGSFAECPQAFVSKGTIDDALGALGWPKSVPHESGLPIEVPAGLAGELLQLADEPVLGCDRAEALAKRCFDAGLLPHLLDLDVESFGLSGQRDR